MPAGMVHGRSQRATVQDVPNDITARLQLRYANDVADSQATSYLGFRTAKQFGMMDTFGLWDSFLA